MFYLIESRQNHRLIELHVFTSKSARKEYKRYESANLPSAKEHDLGPHEFTKITILWANSGMYKRPQKITPIEVEKLHIIFH